LSGKRRFAVVGFGAITAEILPLRLRAERVIE
jgi:hypothetical protein